MSNLRVGWAGLGLAGLGWAGVLKCLLAMFCLDPEADISAVITGSQSKCTASWVGGADVWVLCVCQEKIDYGALIQELGGVYIDQDYFTTKCTHLVVGKFFCEIASHDMLTSIILKFDAEADTQPGKAYA